jgi:hypothetical protein
MEKTKFDPTRRRLCPDGVCIGVIGADGRCKVCGRADDGSPVAAVGDSASPEPDLADADDDAGADATTDDDGGGGDEQAASGDGDGHGAELEAAPGGFDPKRRLCDDGTCIGVIGADGVCSVCGRRAEG